MIAHAAAQFKIVTVRAAATASGRDDGSLNLLFRISLVTEILVSITRIKGRVQT